MRAGSPTPLRLALSLAAGLLIVKVTLGVVAGYRGYAPPDFGSDFLRGRESYFRGAYRWAFYPHIASGPVALLLGLVLVGGRFRARYPGWHRALGRVAVAVILLGVVPSGLGMAGYAAAGPVAGAGLAALAVATGACAGLGWRAAMAGRSSDHRRWMWRTFLLLASAVVLRVVGGLASLANFTPDWLDPLAAWASWLVPLGAFEWAESRGR